MTCYSSDSGSSAEKTRVLIVDADPRVLAALRATIGAEHDLVVSGAVSDVQTAVSLAAMSAPCVALLDVGACDTDADLLPVQRLSRVAGCLVVAMSVRSGVAAAVLGAGAVDFVVKGGDIEALLSVIRETRPPGP